VQLSSQPSKSGCTDETRVTKGTALESLRSWFRDAITTDKAKQVG